MSKSHNEYQNPPASRKSLAFCGKTWIVVLLIVVLTFLLAKYSQLKAIAAGIQPADANEWKKLLAAHPYQPPPPGASRGPCPALNTLANHGFLPRDGRNITADQLFEAVLTVGLPPVHTYLVVKGVFHTYRHNHPSDSFLSNFRSMPSLDLHLLTTHNLLEHDVSLSRQDDNVAPHDAAVVQPQFVERLAQMAVDGFVLDKHVADHRKIRWLESLRDNKLLHFTLRMQLIAHIECAVLLDVLGRDGAIRADHLRSFFLEEKFPDDWYPPESSKGSLSISRIRQCYLNVQKSTASLPENSTEEQ